MQALVIATAGSFLGMSIALLIAFFFVRKIAAQATKEWLKNTRSQAETCSKCPTCGQGVTHINLKDLEDQVIE